MLEKGRMIFYASKPFSHNRLFWITLVHNSGGISSDQLKGSWKRIIVEVTLFRAEIGLGFRYAFKGDRRLCGLKEKTCREKNSKSRL